MDNVITVAFGDRQPDPVVDVDDDGTELRFSQEVTAAERACEAAIIDVLVDRHGIPRSAIATMLDRRLHGSGAAVVTLEVCDAEGDKLVSMPLAYGLGMHDAERVELHLTNAVPELGLEPFAICYDLIGASYHLELDGDRLDVITRSHADPAVVADLIVQHLQTVPALRRGVAV